MAENRIVAAVIANGGTTADVDLMGKSLAGIFSPVMTGTSVALQASWDGTNYVIVYVAGSAAAITVSGTARFAALDPGTYAGIRHLRLVSNGAEGAARTLRVVVV